MLSEETCARLRQLTNEELRAIKIRTSDARNDHDRKLFRFVDRLLTAREGIVVPRRADLTRFEKF